MATTAKKTTTVAKKTTTAKPAVKKPTTTKNVLDMLKKKFDEVWDEGSIYTVKLNNKYGFVDKDGKILISPCFKGIESEFIDGAICTWGEKGVGFVNNKGKEIVKPIYKSSKPFSKGLAAVNKNGKWGFIDKKGKEVIKLIYDEVSQYDGSKIKVKLDGKEFYIDANGKSLTKTNTATNKTTANKTTTTAKSTTEISVTGNKKIETLCKEFNKKFPCLQLCIFYSYARQQVAKGEKITPIDRSKTIASVRRADSGGDISISGNKKIKSLEKEFDTVFGLYCQVCYYSPEGKGYYTSGSNDEKTLSAFNAECEKRGCPKNKWK